MKRGGEKIRFGMLIAAAAMTALTACSPKKSFASSKTPISENKPSPVLFSEWSGGTCSLNKLFGTLTYKDKKNKEVNSFEVNVPEDGKVVGLHCFDEKTVIVAEDEVAVYKQGALMKTSEVDESMLSALNGNFGSGMQVLAVAKTMPNEKNEKNITSAVMGDSTIILARNKETGAMSLTEITNDIDSEANYYHLGKIIEGNVSMTVHNGLLFIAGEAKRNMRYLFAMKLGEKVVGFPFDAKKQLKGEVKFTKELRKTQGDEMLEEVLVLEIGKDKFYITAEYSPVELLGFMDMGDNQNFARIVIEE